jgi:hypothetical protein
MAKPMNSSSGGPSPPAIRPRVVLDIRSNGGGNNFLNRFVVKEIIRRPALDQPDRLLVLIGRGVFSAAQNLVNELDCYTNATFVGEPTGNAPNQYGDARRLELPRSKIRVFISSLYWPQCQSGIVPRCPPATGRGPLKRDEETKRGEETMRVSYLPSSSHFALNVPETQYPAVNEPVFPRQPSGRLP